MSKAKLNKPDKTLTTGKPLPVVSVLWEEVKIRLKDIVPWDQNPRQMTEKQAKRIMESLETFGQAQVIAVGPDNELYDGHQRVSAMKVLYGDDYLVDARRANKPLTVEQRKKLVLLLHAGAVGNWDWDMLGEWDVDFIVSHGLDTLLVKEIGGDISAILAMQNAGDDIFKPDYAPMKGAETYTSQDIQRVEDKQANRFSGGRTDLTEFECPSCHKRFYINVIV